MVLQLCQVPPELSSLSALELRLICLRVPFLKMVALPTGKQRSIHGPAVNVPSKVDTICEVLPSQAEMVPLKLKRIVAYRGHYMYLCNPTKTRQTILCIVILTGLKVLLVMMM